MGDIPGGKELPFFDIHCARLAGNLSDKVGLPAEKSGNLENVEITGCRIDLLKAMDVGKDRDIERFPDLFQNCKPPGQTGSPIAVARGPVRLVIGGFEDKRNPQFSGKILEVSGNLHGLLFALDDAGTGDERKRRTSTDLKPSYTDGFHECLVSFIAFVSAG